MPCCAAVTSPLRLFSHHHRQGDVALPPYYQPEEDDEMPFICSLSGDNGIMGCHEIPPLKEQGRECCLSKDDVYDFGAGRQDLNASGLCVNWNRYYNVCRTGSANPHKGAINFDNIGYAWIVIFQVRPLGLAAAPRLGPRGREGRGGEQLHLAGRALCQTLATCVIEICLTCWHDRYYHARVMDRATEVQRKGYRPSGVLLNVSVPQFSYL